MRLIILGSGTAYPLVDRASPSLLCFCGEIPVLFDMGPGTIRQLTRAGIGWDRIGQIFFTHFHPDHTADLVHFLFATRYPPVLEKRAPFRITAARGVKDFMERLKKAYGTWLELPGEMMETDELDPSRPEQRDYGFLRLTSQPVSHTPHSLAYRIENSSGKNFVYSGDTGFCSEIIEISNQTDLLILECAFPDDGRVRGEHLSPSQAGRIASSAGAKRLLLLHFYPEVLATDITLQCRRHYSGELILARDMLYLNV